MAPNYGSEQRREVIAKVQARIIEREKKGGPRRLAQARSDREQVYLWLLAEAEEWGTGRWNCDDCEAPTNRPGLCDHCQRCPAGSDCAEEDCEAVR